MEFITKLDIAVELTGGDFYNKMVRATGVEAQADMVTQVDKLLDPATHQVVAALGGFAEQNALRAHRDCGGFTHGSDIDGQRLEQGAVSQFHLAMVAIYAGDGRCCSNQGTIPQFGDLIS